MSGVGVAPVVERSQGRASRAFTIEGTFVRMAECDVRYAEGIDSSIKRLLPSTLMRRTIASIPHLSRSCGPSAVSRTAMFSSEPTVTYMTRNLHIIPQLDAFAALPAPGFALMIDAPWGAGKTHALQNWLKDRRHLYVSLYGVQSRDEIERAIFLARLSAIDNGTARAVATLVSAGVEALAAHYKIKNQLKVKDLAQAALPQLLIFDDLERTEMSVNELLSALNRYVENEKRNVILIANQAELRRTSPERYDATREKVVGRCISILPEVDEALDAFISSLKEAPSLAGAYEFCAAERQIIMSVFLKSECSNLRLLRQAIFEFARFFDQVPQEIRDHEEAMRHLLGTFVVLSVAFHGDEKFGADSLQQDPGWNRILWDINGKKGEEPPKSSLETLQYKFQGVPYVELHGSIISARLASEWIGRGHAADDVVAEELQKSVYFRIRHAEAWQTLWHWTKRPAETVDLALKNLRIQLASREITNPSIIMHVAGILLDLGENRLGWTSREMAAQEIQTYIEFLEKEDLLPTEYPRQKYRPEIISESDFGLGYMHRDTPEFKAINENLLSALDRAFWRANVARGNKLMEIVKKDARTFAAIIDTDGRSEDLPNYAHVPVLTGINVEYAAQTIFGLSPDATYVALLPFKDRWTRLRPSMDDLVHENEWPDELEWIRQFRAAAEKIAESDEPIRAAQIRKMISWTLSFLDEIDPPKH